MLTDTYNFLCCILIFFYFFLFGIIKFKNNSESFPNYSRIIAELYPNWCLQKRIISELYPNYTRIIPESRIFDPAEPNPNNSFVTMLESRDNPQEY